MQVNLFILTSLVSISKIVLGSNEPLMDILNNYEKTASVSELCHWHLSALKNGIENDEMWALKVRDMSGKKTFGFTLGNNFWLGSERACLHLNNPPKIHLKHSDRRKMWDNATDIASEIPLTYRMFYIAHTSQIQFDIDVFNQSVLHIGVCLPKACIDNDARMMGEKILLPITCKGAIYGDKLSFENTRSLELRNNFPNEVFVILLKYMILFFSILITIGTFYTEMRKSSKLSSLVDPNDDCKKFTFVHENLTKKQFALADKFWSCFSLHKNYEFIMSPNLGKDSLEPIHGIRAFGIIWIIIGHMYYYALSSSDNLQLAFAFAESWILQPFFAAAISVDSFYTISGLLLAYGFYEKQKRKPSNNLTIDVLRGIVYRYIRIAPCFMILMLFAVTMSIFLNDTSQFLVVENIEVNCKLYWWRNLLFIQNLYPFSEMCLSWSWYVSTDFQLFILSSIFLAISAKNMKLAVISSLLFSFICSLYTGYVGIRESFGFSLDNQYHSIDDLYIKPYTRAAQYITGLWAGYYMSKINRQFGVRKFLVNLGWIASIVTLLSLVFVQIYKPVNVWISFFFPALGRILWSLPICFIVIAGSSEHKDGFFAKILNSKLLLPFSRMSFSAYLFNPLVIMFLTLASESPFHLDFYTMPVFIVGFYIITYFSAFIFMLMFENPIIMLVRNFTK